MITSGKIAIEYQSPTSLHTQTHTCEKVHSLALVDLSQTSRAFLRGTHASVSRDVTVLRHNKSLHKGIHIIRTRDWKKKTKGIRSKTSRIRTSLATKVLSSYTIMNAV